MGTTINDIITINITRETAKLTRVGFGTPLVFGEHAKFDLGELSRVYNNITAVEEDFATTDEEYKAAAKIFGQEVSPTQIIIGDRSANAIQKMTATVDTVENNTDYYAYINGVEFKVTSDADATAIEIAGLLVAAINGGSEPVTATDNADGTYYCVSDVSGDPFTFTTGTRQSITQVTVVTVDTATAETDYMTKINAVKFTVTSDATPTVIEIAGLLVAAINAGSEPVTATDNADGTYDLDADAAGAQFNIWVDSRQSIAGDRPNVNVASELSALRIENDDWYGLVLTRSATEAKQIQDIKHAAAYIEPLMKIYLPCIDQSTIPTAATDDVASIIKGLDYDHTGGVFYSGNEANYPEAAWFGKQLPKDPGSTNWNFQSLSGIVADDLTASQVSYLGDKNCNYYETVGGVNITLGGGIVASGEYLDIIRGADWLGTRMAEGIFALLVNAEKVPFTTQGIGQIEDVIRYWLQKGVDKGFVVDGSIVITVPDIDDVDPVDKALRFLNDVSWSAQLQGAVNKVSIQGRLTV